MRRSAFVLRSLFIFGVGIAAAVWYVAARFTILGESEEHETRRIARLQGRVLRWAMCARASWAYVVAAAASYVHGSCELPPPPSCRNGENASCSAQRSSVSRDGRPSLVSCAVRKPPVSAANDGKQIGRAHV